MELEEAIKVLKNMDITYENETTCKECIFDNNKKCYDENGDCQMKAIETILQALEEQDKEIVKYQLYLTEEVIPKKKIEEFVLHLKLLKRHIALNDEQRKGYDVCIEEAQNYWRINK